MQTVDVRGNAFAEPLRIQPDWEMTTSNNSDKHSDRFAKSSKGQRSADRAWWKHSSAESRFCRCAAVPVEKKHWQGWAMQLRRRGIFPCPDCIPHSWFSSLRYPCHSQLRQDLHFQVCSKVVSSPSRNPDFGRC